MSSDPDEEFTIQVSSFEALNTDADVVIKSLPCRRAVADIFFIADSSTSIGITAFNELKRFATSVVSRFTIGPNHIKIGLITFSDDAEIEFKLNTYGGKSNIINTILNIPYTTGITNTHKAIQLLYKDGFTRANGERGNTVPKIAIVVTDGASTKPLHTKMQAIKANNQGIIMFAIGMFT
ncbi:matrilin-3-like [Mytilus edulis]|uniref:matrilin-3-like n=1 Tax=Mytilus edulis TaxID=6550 RepID=UPI0039EF6605